MIFIEEKKIEPDDKGNDVNVSIKINCESMKDVLREYTFLTAHIRDMLIINGVNDDEKVKSTVFAAFRAGLEKVPHTKESQLVLDGMAQHRKLS
ncbi:MAG: hypothetical protein K6B74_14135 [Ruminococcus sp.]|nr:hypothetical protein [Ruminococcus sp.]